MDQHNFRYRQFI